jgi:phosphatidylinositol 4-kinase A
VRHVLDGIEFYLPQLAHMIIHLEVEWDDAILERFALVIAQQSIHFALQLNWILQGALQDYQPEHLDGSPNPTYHPLFYTRCLKLLRNVERCVVYGKPRAQELQRLYETGEISKGEMEQLEQADRRFNALQITTKGEDFDNVLGRAGILDGWMSVQLPKILKKGGLVDTSDNPHDFVQRFCVLDRSVLNFYTSQTKSKLDRAVVMENSQIQAEEQGGSLLIRIKRPHCTIRLKCASAEEQTLWLRRLKEEAHTSALFTHGSKLRTDLTPAQSDRYDLFQNERKFVQALTDLAETLRDKERDERKKLAPSLLAKLEIPDTVYLPLCNSSDIWRRAVTAIPNETRVFNTKERCPVIMYFISKRGETVKKGISRITDPNLDVAQFLHVYFDVAALETMEEIAEEGENPDENVVHSNERRQPMEEAANRNIEVQHVEMRNGVDVIKTKMDDHSNRNFEQEGSYSVVWSDEADGDGNDPAPPSPTDLNRAGLGNKKVQRLLGESFVTLPSKLAKRLPTTRGMGPRRRSVMDRLTEMQPMVQIIEGRGEDADNASIGDGTVISIERSSVLVGKDLILYGGLDEGAIDIDCIDRAKQYVSGGETWAEKSARMLGAATATMESEGESAGNSGVQLEIASCMSKSNDDLRQEVFVMQMIHYYKSVFAQAKLPLWLKTYRILSSSSSTGLIEVLTDATSLDGLKKSSGYPEEGGLRKYFEMVYGDPSTESFKAAQTNFMQSLAAYALVSWLLGLKDRHNGNIMIDTRGHLIFIDFGFALGMAPGHEFSMERAPFKLTKEYVDVLGGIRSDCYKEFERLFVAGFAECRKNSQIALGLVEIMMYKSNYPCFSGWRYGKGRALTKMEKRLMLRVPEKSVPRKALRLIRSSRQHFGTYLYDAFQKASNGYAM